MPKSWKKDEDAVVVAMGKKKGHIKLKKLPTTLTCCFAPDLILGKVPKGCEVIGLL